MNRTRNHVERRASQRRRRGGAPKGNLNRQTHGGSSGLQRLHDDAPFVGLAQEMQKQVEQELAQQGTGALLKRAAVRLETVASLFYNAIQGASQARDLDALDRFAQRFGWLQASAARLWVEVAKNERDGSHTVDYETVIQRGEEKDEAAPH